MDGHNLPINFGLSRKLHLMHVGLLEEPKIVPYI